MNPLLCQLSYAAIADDDAEDSNRTAGGKGGSS